jgi:hypothetical protein
VPEFTFDIDQQKNTQWCWAAVAVSICRYYKDNRWPQQCALVNDIFVPIRGSTDCCQNSDFPCDTPWALDEVLSQSNHLGQSFGVVGFGQLNREITANRPIGVRINFGGILGFHFIILAGAFVTQDGTQMVKVADPSLASGNINSIQYDTLTDDYKPGAIWDQTYFTCR